MIMRRQEATTMAGTREEEHSKCSAGIPLQDQRERIEDDERHGESDSDDDELLAAAAAQWASSIGNDDDDDETATTDSRQQQTLAPTSRPQTWSLHVTQLPFQTTDYEIRTHFAERGCSVTSVRMVYDRGDQQKVFRGVAFVDVDNESSYERALQLDRSRVKGRRINVRPTLQKTELADIVQRTKERLAEQRKQQDETLQNDQNQKTQTNHDAKSKNRAPKASAKGNKSPSKKQQHSKHSRRSDHRGDRKLTKKERNRKAAILMSRKGRGRK